MSAGSERLRALDAVLGSVEGVRNLPAFGLLLATFAAAGLLLAMFGHAASRGAWALSTAYALAASVVAFYGCNAAGILVMDDARGRSRRGVGDALALAFRQAHRLLGALALIAGLYVAVALVLVVVLVACRMPVLGPIAYTVVMPAAVVIAGLALLAVPTVIVPLAAPAVWGGAGPLECVRRLLQIARTRLPSVVVMMSAVSLLAGLMGALVMFAVMVGGQSVARLSVLLLGVDAPLPQLMAGLFGVGPRGLAGAGVQLGNPYALAAAVGGGMVFVAGLVLPGLVYLRGACAVYLTHSDTGPGPAPSLRGPLSGALPSGAGDGGPLPPGADRGILTSSFGTGDTTISMARPPDSGWARAPRSVDVLLPLDDEPPGASPLHEGGNPSVSRSASPRAHISDRSPDRTTDRPVDRLRSRDRA